jgi:histidyl-tRNA synthetase
MARTEPARGMRDFLAEDVRRREHVIGIVRRVFEGYGYEPLETPAVENLDTLLGKYGDEGNQLIFKILKRGEHEASGQADLALRYDLTVPLARVVAHHQAKLPRLYKRYQIQPVWRADRPARGRFREFYQCDIDAAGSTSPLVEAEQCAAVGDVLTALGFADFTIRLNHRQVLAGLLRAAGVPADLEGPALVAIDKFDKIGREGVLGELGARGLDPAAAAALVEVLLSGPEAGGDHEPGVSLASLRGAVGGDPGALAGLETLDEVLRLTAGTGAEGRLRVDPSLARGLSYYTGAIMEVGVPDLAGSLAGGGRYDNLVGMFSKQAVPACGFSLGLERLLVVMGERGMFPASLDGPPADVLVAAFDAATAAGAVALAGRLRAAGLRALVYPDPGKLGRQFKYADERRIPFVAVVGEDEMASGQVTVKDLASGTQDTIAQEAAGAAIVERLRTSG